MPYDSQPHCFPAHMTSAVLRHMFMCVCAVCQFTREARFTGEGYLGLKMDDVLNPDNFYAGIGFRTDQQTGLMFYRQGQVQTTV